MLTRFRNCRTQCHVKAEAVGACSTMGIVGSTTFPVRFAVFVKITFNLPEQREELHFTRNRLLETGVVLLASGAAVLLYVPGVLERRPAVLCGRFVCAGKTWRVALHVCNKRGVKINRFFETPQAVPVDCRNLSQTN